MARLPRLLQVMQVAKRPFKNMRITRNFAFNHRKERLPERDNHLAGEDLQIGGEVGLV
jgi:hypothetical protein